MVYVNLDANSMSMDCIIPSFSTCSWIFFRGTPIDATHAFPKKPGLNQKAPTSKTYIILIDIEVNVESRILNTCQSNSLYYMLNIIIILKK